jgi:hypothetical protein
MYIHMYWRSANQLVCSQSGSKQANNLADIATYIAFFLVVLDIQPPMPPSARMSGTMYITETMALLTYSLAWARSIASQPASQPPRVTGGADRAIAGEHRSEQKKT